MEFGFCTWVSRGKLRNLSLSSQSQHASVCVRNTMIQKPKLAISLRYDVKYQNAPIFLQCKGEGLWPCIPPPCFIHAVKMPAAPQSTPIPSRRIANVSLFAWEGERDTFKSPCIITSKLAETWKKANVFGSIWENLALQPKNKSVSGKISNPKAKQSGFFSQFHK